MKSFIIIFFTFFTFFSSYFLSMGISYTSAAPVFPEESKFITAAEETSDSGAGAVNYNQVVSSLQKGGSDIGKGAGYLTLSAAQGVSVLFDLITDTSLQAANYVRATKKSLIDSVLSGLTSLANVTDSTSDKGIQYLGEVNKNVKSYRSDLFNNFEKRLQ